MNDLTDHDRIDSEAELDRQEKEDVDLFAIPDDWYQHARLEIGIPSPLPAQNKQPVSIRR